MTFLRALFSIPFLVLLLYGLRLNVKLYHRPLFKTTTAGSYNQDVYFQLQHLKGELAQGAAEEMQRLYPEGYVFLISLYSLSWANLIDELEATAPEF